MATATPSTELAFMDVIFFMTSDTITYRRFYLRGSGAMTGMTIQSGMGSIQRRACLAPVIKQPELPRIGVVAHAALPIEPPLVIAVLVTISTLP